MPKGKWMKLTLCTILLLMLSLTACSRLSEQPLNTDLNSNRCCTSLAELPFNELTVPMQQRIAMDGDQPILINDFLEDSDTAAQPFPVMVYRIDEQQDAFTLFINAYINNNALFSPRIMLFNEDWQLLSEIRSDKFSYQPAGLQGLERIETNVVIDSQNSDIRYILMTVDSALLNTKLERLHLEALYAQRQQIIGNKQLPLYATFKHVGVIDVAVSSSSKNTFSTLLTSLGLSSTSQVQQVSIIEGENESADNWPIYKIKIDQALAAGDIKRAAVIANQADEKQIPQAKDYLLKQLTE